MIRRRSNRDPIQRRGNDLPAEELERLPDVAVGGYLPVGFARDQAAVMVCGRDDGFGAIWSSSAPEWETWVPRENDELFFWEEPGITGAALWSATVWVATYVVLPAVISTALTLGIQAIMRASTTGKKTQDAPDTTYSFEGIRTTAASGIPIPVAFGYHGLGGNIISMSTHGTYVGQTPSTTDENLYLELGLCKGPVDSVDSIEINGNQASDYNGIYELGINGSNEIGTLDQEPLATATLASAATNQAIGLDLVSTSTIAGNGETRSFTTDVAVDRVDLNIYHPEGLYRLRTSGYDVFSVEWRVRYKLNSGSTWSAWENVWVEAARPSPFTSTSTHPLPERGIYDFEVERYTERAPDSNRVNTIQLSTATLRVNDLYSYPGIVHLGIRLIANEALNRQLPTVMATGRWFQTERWDGVDPDDPTYEPDAPDYDNPAWIILSMLRMEELDMHAILGYAEIDLTSILELAEWCDDLVPDGHGGTEKRCRFDGVFTGDDTALDALLRVCSTCRAVPLIVGSTIKIKFERDREPVQMFSMATIERGSFSITYMSKRKAATWYGVRFLNEEHKWDIDETGIDDPDAIARSLPPVRSYRDLWGITRQSQALREAHYMLNLDRYLGEIVQFTTAVNAIHCEPGDIVEVQHDLPAWGSGGRLVGAGSAAVRLDRDVVIEAGIVYEICVMSSSDDLVQTRTVSNAPGSYAADSILYVTDGWETEPAIGDVYSFGRQNIVTRPIVVSAMKLLPSFQVQITGLGYNAAIHLDDIPELDDPDYSDLPNPGAIPPCADPPPGAAVRTAPATGGGGWENVIDVTWSFPAGYDVASTRVYLRDLDAPAPPAGFEIPFELREMVPAPATGTTIRGGLVDGDEYEVRVIFVAPDGGFRAVEDCSGTTVELVNTGVMPAAPTGLQMTITNLDLRLRWNAVPDAQLYEVRRGGEQWQQSRYIGVVPASGAPEITTTLWNPTSGTGNPAEVFYVRAINAGVYGPPASEALPAGPIYVTPWRGTGLEIQRDENGLGWPGTLSNLTVNGAGYLELTDTSLPGSYISPEVDLGSEASYRVGVILRAVIDNGPTMLTTASAYNSVYGVDEDWNGPIDPADWYASTRVFVRFSDTLGGTSSEAWLEEYTADYSGIRYAQIKIEMETSSDTWEPITREVYLTAERFGGVT